jgi:hypothetical protein
MSSEAEVSEKVPDGRGLVAQGVSKGQAGYRKAGVKVQCVRPPRLGDGDGGLLLLLSWSLLCF